MKRGREIGRFCIGFSEGCHIWPGPEMLVQTFVNLFGFVTIFYVWGGLKKSIKLTFKTATLHSSILCCNGDSVDYRATESLRRPNSRPSCATSEYCFAQEKVFFSFFLFFFFYFLFFPSISHLFKKNLRLERGMYNQTREMAEELNKMVKKRIGAAAYLPIFQEITQKAAKKREERKRKSNMTLILDPQVKKK